MLSFPPIRGILTRVACLHVAALLWRIASLPCLASLPYAGFVLANKSDLDEDMHAVDEDEARAFAEAQGLDFHTCSVKDGVGVKEPLQALAKRVAQRFSETVEAARAAAST